MRNNFGINVYCLKLNSEVALAAANYPLSASYIDTKPYRRFGFLILMGALDTATTFQVRQDTSATQTASIKDVTGAVWIAGTGDDDQAAFIEVDQAALDTNNSFRYVTCAVSGPTGNDYGAMAFLGWLAREVPVTQPATFPVVDNYVLVAG